MNEPSDSDDPVLSGVDSGDSEGDMADDHCDDVICPVCGENRYELRNSDGYAGMWCSRCEERQLDQAQAACAAMERFVTVECQTCKYYRQHIDIPCDKCDMTYSLWERDLNPGQPLLDRLATQAKEIEDLRAAIEAMARDVLLVGIVNQEPHVGKWEYTIVKAGLHSGWEGPYNTAADAALAGVEATKKEK